MILYGITAKMSLGAEAHRERRTLIILNAITSSGWVPGSELVLRVQKRQELSRANELGFV